MTVISEILGLPAQDRDRFRQWTFNAGPGASRLREPDGYLADLVARKRQAPQEQHPVGGTVKLLELLVSLVITRRVRKTASSA